MKRRFITGFCMAVALVLLAGTGFAAEWANPSLLLSPDEVKANIEKPLLCIVPLAVTAFLTVVLFAIIPKIYWYLQQIPLLTN